MNLAQEWVRCRQWLLPAIERAKGTHSEQDIVDGLLNGMLTLWPGEKSAIVTEILLYPRIKALNWFLAGGDLNELLGMEVKIREWAKENGCKRVTLGGRKGWKRVLPGYEDYMTLLFKDL